VRSCGEGSFEGVAGIVLRRFDGGERKATKLSLSRSIVSMTPNFSCLLCTVL